MIAKPVEGTPAADIYLTASSDRHRLSAVDLQADEQGRCGGYRRDSGDRLQEGLEFKDRELADSDKVRSLCCSAVYRHWTLKGNGTCGSVRAGACCFPPATRTNTVTYN